MGDSLGDSLGDSSGVSRCFLGVGRLFWSFSVVSRVLGAGLGWSSASANSHVVSLERQVEGGEWVKVEGGKGQKGLGCRKG